MISTALAMLVTLPFLPGCVRAVGDAQHGDGQRDVGLDGLDDVAGRGALLAQEAQKPVARLGQRREGLEGLEGGGQPAAVAFGLGGAAGVGAGFGTDRSCGFMRGSSLMRK